MVVSFTPGDGSDPLSRHISWPYFVPEIASTRDAFYGPYNAVQSISSSTSCSEVEFHPRGPIPHFGGLLV